MDQKVQIRPQEKWVQSRAKNKKSRVQILRKLMRRAIGRNSNQQANHLKLFVMPHKKVHRIDKSQHKTWVKVPQFRDNWQAKNQFNRKLWMIKRSLQLASSEHESNKLLKIRKFQNHRNLSRAENHKVIATNNPTIRCHSSSKMEHTQSNVEKDSHSMRMPVPLNHQIQPLTV